MSRKTIADVARAAGVSKSTVSRVLGGKTRYMKAETRERVLQAINTLGYRPSVVARSLISKRTLTAGLLISDIGNPFYHEVIRGVEDVAVAHDYSIFFCNTNYDPARSKRHFHSLVDKQVDGVLFMASGDYSQWTLIEAARHSLPLVLVDWSLAEVPPQALLSNITLDFESGIREAVAHLVSLGHRRIAHVSGPESLETARKRKEAFLAALQDYGLASTEALVIEGNLRVEGGRQALDAILNATPRPTAVLAAKISETRALEGATGKIPLLLLDDVSSELDRERNSRLFAFLAGVGGQVFVTTTHGDHISVFEDRVDFGVTEGRVERIETQAPVTSSVAPA